MSRPGVSQHLGVLLESKLISVRREGTRRIYRANLKTGARLRAELATIWDESLLRLKSAAEAAGRKGDITREIFIAATPDTVFGFLIDPALIMKWIGISHQLEPRPGGIFRVEISAGNIARGIYTEVIRPYRVAFTWGWETHAADLTALASLPPGASLVEIDLMPKGDGTVLRFRHSLLPKALSKLHDARWSIYLDRLKTAASCHAPAEQPDATDMSPET